MGRDARVSCYVVARSSKLPAGRSRDAVIGSHLLELCCFQQLGNLVPPWLPRHGTLCSATTGTSGRPVTSAWKPSPPSRHHCRERIVTLTSLASRTPAR